MTSAGSRGNCTKVQYLVARRPRACSCVQKLLAPIPVRLDARWGLDHDTWAVLCHVYPKRKLAFRPGSRHQPLSGAVRGPAGKHRRCGHPHGRLQRPKPCDARLMRCYPVSTRVSHVTNEVPGLWNSPRLKIGSTCRGIESHIPIF